MWHRKETRLPAMCRPCRTTSTNVLKPEETSRDTAGPAIEQHTYSLTALFMVSRRVRPYDDDSFLPQKFDGSFQFYRMAAFV